MSFELIPNGEEMTLGSSDDVSPHIASCARLCLPEQWKIFALLAEGCWMRIELKAGHHSVCLELISGELINI